MFQCLEFFVLTCLFLAAKTTTGQILPPQNLSLHWKDEFNPELTWEPPLHSMANCVYEGEIRSNKQKYQTASFSTSNRSFSELMYMEGGFCHYSLRTVCGNNQSELAVLEISYPELVKMLDCYVYAAKQTHCSWSSVWNDTDLRFFYQLRTNFVDGPPAKLQECSSYNYTDDVKSGCNLPASSQMSIGMFFNATLNNTVVWNTFSQNRLKVKPPAPTWTVKESKDQFSINWIPPDILRQDSWAYQITYTECNKQNTVYVEEQTSFVLQRVFNCSYCIWIEANSESGNSPPSDKQCFDPQDRLFVVYIVIALIITLMVVSIMCLKRNKDYIFPKIPVPPNFIKDVIENNNENFFHKLYIPAEEEENCTVMVVRGVQTNKPDC